MSRRSGPSRTGDKLRPVRLRMSAAMSARMNERAKNAGLTGGAYVRALIGRDLSLDDPADLQPVIRYGGTPDGNAMHALRMQLHQTGGLLTQVAKVARKEGEAARHGDAEAALADVQAAIDIIKGWQAERNAR